jgi:hypothetical protein
MKVESVSISVGSISKLVGSVSEPISSVTKPIESISKPVGCVSVLNTPNAIKAIGAVVAKAARASTL